MSTAAPLSDCVALRIALAARALPEGNPALLLRVLLAALGEPLTEQKLSNLTIKHLKTASNGALAEIDRTALGQALALLKGESENSTADLPQPCTYHEGDMPSSIRVAIASNGGERLDGHFGSCVRFLIYQVSATETRLIAVRAAPAAAQLSVDHSAKRVALIDDCDLLVILSIGGPAAARVVNSGVHPIKRAEPQEAQTVLNELQTVLAGKPPPWLTRIQTFRNTLVTATGAAMADVVAGETS